MKNITLGKYLSLEDFCTCTSTYKKYQEQIKPYPQKLESITALKKLNQLIIDPIIDNFGRDKFQLTYGFCSRDLKRFLNKKDPITGIKNGRVEPSIDQHMAWETNSKGNYYCPRLGAACDFSIKETSSAHVVDWIVTTKLPFDSVYFYSSHKPIHISYGPQHKRVIWAFNATGQPTKKGTEKWQTTN